MTGGPELALELEERGYDWIKEKIDAEDAANADKSRKEE